MSSTFCTMFGKLCRTKSAESVTSDTSLHRCLGIIDLIAIGLGGIIGSGIYVMSGIAIREQAGPSTVLSFFMAGCVVLLIAACFTELASKLHKTGSTYLYLYLTIGEFPAFVFGFSNLILSCLSGAVNARAWSYYLDSVFNNAISNFTIEHIAEWDIGSPIARYPDFMAMFLMIVLTVVISLGAKFSAKFSSVFVVIDILVLSTVSICGFIFGNIKNWTQDGVSSFFPFGWSGTLQATSICFWAYSGFELISCAVEETKNPKRDIPVATCLTMLVVMFLYITTTSALSLMVPYNTLSATTPLASVFVDIGQTWGRYVVSVGTLGAFATSILSNFYGFVRIALAMAEDGLLFPCFKNVNHYTKVPVLPTVFCGVLEALIALFLDIQEIINFSVNLILLSYCAVCASVIIISYTPRPDYDDNGSAIRNEYTVLETDDAGDNAPPDNNWLADDNVIWTATDNVRMASDNATDNGTAIRKDYTILENDVASTDNNQLSADNVRSLTDASSDLNAINGGGNTMTSDESADILHKTVKDSRGIDGTVLMEQNDFPELQVNSKNFKTEPVNRVHEQDNGDEDLINAVDGSDNSRSDAYVGYLWKSFACLSPYMICGAGGRCAVFALVMMSLFVLGFAFCITYAIQQLDNAVWWSIVLVIITGIGSIVFLGIICIHRQTYRHVIMKFHCVPIVPSVALALCLILLVSSATTSSWIGCGVLLVSASLVYSTYSVHHSKLNPGSSASQETVHLLAVQNDSGEEMALGDS